MIDREARRLRKRLHKLHSELFLEREDRVRARRLHREAREIQEKLRNREGRT